jgi:hypothetical protein
MVQKGPKMSEIRMSDIRRCLDCGVVIPPHPGSGRPRLRCQRCARPLSNRDYWQAVRQATRTAPGYPGSPEFDAYMAPVYEALGGERSASRKREVEP